MVEGTGDSGEVEVGAGNLSARYFSCCFIDNVNMWARFVAYIDLLFSIVSIAYALMQLDYDYKMSLKASQSQQVQNCDQPQHQQIVVGDRFLEPMVDPNNPFSVVSLFGPNPFAYLGGTILVFVLSIVAIIGIHKKIPDCILLWLIATYFETVVEILLCFVSILSIGTAALLFAPFLAFQIFSIWSVHLFRQQVIADRDRDRDEERESREAK